MTATPAGQPDGPKTDSFAVAALVLAILGAILGPLMIIFGPLAVVLGNESKKRIARSNGLLEGSGLAQAGFVIGIIEVVIAVAALVFVGICVASLNSMY